jgi:hypothetical protein
VVSKSLGKEHPLPERNTSGKNGAAIILDTVSADYLYLKVMGSPLCYVVIVTNDIQQRLSFQKAVLSDALLRSPLAAMQITAKTSISKKRHSLFL